MNHNYVVNWVEVCFTYKMFRNLALVTDFRRFVIIILPHIYYFYFLLRVFEGRVKRIFAGLLSRYEVRGR